MNFGEWFLFSVSRWQHKWTYPQIRDCPMGLFLITRSENFRRWNLYPSFPSKQREPTLHPRNVGYINELYTLIFMQFTIHKILWNGIHYVWYYTLLIRVTIPRRLGRQRLMSERERKLTIFTICCINLILIIKPDLRNHRQLLVQGNWAFFVVDIALLQAQVLES